MTASAAGPIETLRNHWTWRSSTLSTVVLLGILTRLYRLTARSLWLDEFYSVTVRGTFPFWQLLIARDPHPPFYYILLGSWMELLGNGVAAVRGLSAIAGVVVILAAYVAGRELGRPSAGLFAGTVVAVSPLHVQFSQTARMYSLLLALSTGAFAAFSGLYADQGRARRYFLYVMTAIPMVYTHVMGLVVLAVQTGYAIVFGTGGKAPSLSTAQTGRLQTVVGLLSIPWVTVVLWLVFQLLTGGNGGTGFSVGWISAPGLATIWTSLVSYGGALVNYPIDSSNPLLRPLTTGVTILLLGLAGFGFRTGLANLRRRDHHPTMLAAAWFLGPIVLLLVASYLLFPIYSLRFVIVASTGLYLLAGMGLESIPSRPVALTLAALVILGQGAALGVYYDTDTTEQWEPATDSIAATNATDTAVVGVPDHVTMALEYYLPDRFAVLGVNPDDTAVIDAVGGNETLWVVSRYPGQTDTVRQSLEEQYRQTDHDAFGSVQVYRLQRRNETPSYRPPWAPPRR